MSNDKRKIYRIVENYRSIFDRKENLFYWWEIVEEKEKFDFKRADRSVRCDEVLAIRIENTCFIYPWFRSIDLNEKIFDEIETNRRKKLFEIVLIEKYFPGGNSQIDFAFAECPCSKSLRELCRICRAILDSTEENLFEMKFFLMKKNLDKNLQTKLTAFFFPPCPAVKLAEATLESKSLDRSTRSIQVNTLLFLFHEREPIDKTIRSFDFATNFQESGTFLTASKSKCSFSQTKQNDENKDRDKIFFL